MHTQVVRAREDVVATKLGIILSSFLLSMHVLPNLKAELSGGTPTLRFNFFGGRVFFNFLGKPLLGEKYVEGRKEKKKE